MAITEGTQPPPKTFTGSWSTPQTTDSFTPEAGALLVALVAADGGPSPSTPTAAISDSVSGSADWVLLRRQNTTATGLAGTCEVWCRDSPNTAMTVSVTGSGGVQPGGQLVVRTLLGAAAKASQNGAVNGATIKAGAIQCSVAAGTGNRVYGAAFNYTNSTVMTALGNTTGIAFSDGTNNDCWEALYSPSDTAGTATYGFSTAVDGMIAAAEIIAGGVSPVSGSGGLASLALTAAGTGTVGTPGAQGPVPVPGMGSRPSLALWRAGRRGAAHSR